MKFPGDAAERVARSLVEHGPGSSAELAGRLGMSSAGVRKQLRVLIDAGLVVADDRAPYGPAPERRRGRPGQVYSVTPEAHAAADAQYDQIAVEALRFLEREHGATAITAFAEEHARSIGVTMQPDSADAVESVRKALSDAGYAASVEPVGEDGLAVQLCQHHCPVIDVARAFPQLCDAETEVLGQVLGRHVTRLATLAQGDGVCTTLIPMATQQRKVHA
jgi:predicted ArsR family transcriptional regulator